MTLSETYIYRKKPDIVTRGIAGETLLVPIKGELADLQKVFVLQGVGEFIWGKIDGARDRDSIVQDILEVFDVDLETALQDLQIFIEELSRAGLVEEVNP